MKVVMRLPSSFALGLPAGSALEYEADTVRQALDAAITDYPGLRHMVYGPDDSVKGYVNIFVNKRNIKLLSGIETKLADGDEVLITLPMTGG